MIFCRFKLFNKCMNSENQKNLRSYHKRLVNWLFYCMTFIYISFPLYTISLAYFFFSIHADARVQRRGFFSVPMWTQMAWASRTLSVNRKQPQGPWKPTSTSQIQTIVFSINLCYQISANISGHILLQIIRLSLIEMCSTAIVKSQTKSTDSFFCFNFKLLSLWIWSLGKREHQWKAPLFNI